MKKLLLVVFVLSLTVGAAYAEKNYGMAGCGLGSIVIKKDGFVQIFALTTNATFGSQTFGITFGTSNCTQDGVVSQGREKEAFVEVAMVQISRDIAAGEGEYLTTLGNLYGCDNTVMPQFSKSLQNNYGEISKSSDAQTMISTLDRTVTNVPELVKSCTNL